LPCGENLVTVTDSDGRIATCIFSILPETQIDLVSCNGEMIDIKEYLCPNDKTDCFEYSEGNQESQTLYGLSEIPLINPAYSNYPVTLKFSDCNGNISVEYNNK